METFENVIEKVAEKWNSNQQKLLRKLRNSCGKVKLKSVETFEKVIEKVAEKWNSNQWKLLRKLLKIPNKTAENQVKVIQNQWVSWLKCP